MAFVPEGVEEFSPPLLIPSLAPSTEHLPDLLALSVIEPVLASNKRSRLSNFVVPAVRVRAGERIVAVYPLDRESIGDVWDARRADSEWELRDLPRGWAEAVSTFRGYIDYPIEFLSNILSTLRAGNFLDNSPITPSSWREACRSPVDVMSVQSVCARCAVLRSFATRTLLTAPALFPRWNCAHFGLECSIEERHPIYVIAPDQWLVGAREQTPSQSHTPPLDAQTSFPLDALALNSPSQQVVRGSPPSQVPRYDIATPPSPSIPVINDARASPSLSLHATTVTVFLTWTQVPRVTS